MTTRNEGKRGMFSEPMYEVKLCDEETGMTAFVVVNRRVPRDGRSCGGLRMDPHVSLDEVRTLAETMTYKYAIIDIPEGGAKAGIIADPTGLNKMEILKAFAKLVAPLIKEQVYGMGLDMGLTYADLEFIYKEIGTDPFTLAKERLKRRGIDFHVPKGITYETIGGKKFGEFITGYGVCESMFEVCDYMKLKLNELKVAIQGFGTVGSSTAYYLSSRGIKIIAIADIEGTIWNPKGLEIDRVLKAKDKLGKIDRDKIDCGYEKLDEDGWLSVEAEVLIPAAIADAIDSSNDDRVDAKLIVEAANIPIPFDIEEKLQDRGVMIVPDFVANAGAAGGYGLFWSGQVPLGSDEVFPEIGKRIREATIRTLQRSRKSGMSMRNAAREIAEENYMRRVSP